MCGPLGSREIVGTDCEDDGVLFFYRGVVIRQLDELSAAERSPECPIEDQNHVLVASESFKVEFATASARQGKVRR